MTAPGVLYALRANGEQFPIEATISQVQVAGQKLYTVILRDITERKRAEETLLQSEARFRSIYEQAAVGIEQVALDGSLLMVNAALCHMLGYEESELLGKNTAEITHPDDHARELELFRAMQRQQRNSYEIEKRYLHRDHSVVWVHVISSMVSSPAGLPLYRISVIQNTTERKRVEDQLKQAQKMEAIGRLAGGVAHDFNTLLNVMLGYSELLLSELPEGDERRERVVQIKSSGEAGAMLTRQLLAFSRKQATAEEVLDLREAASKMTPMLGRLLRDDIVLSVKCCDGVCPVKVDPGQIQQLVLNLVANAADAMPDGGRLDIEVSTVEVDESFVPPASPAQAGKLCQALGQRYRHRHGPRHRGAYLRAVLHHQGVREGNRPWPCHRLRHRQAQRRRHLGLQRGGCGHGLQGPASAYRRGAASRRSPRKPCPQALHGTGETILLVEDSAALRELTKVILVRDGYNILEAEDGMAALELSRAFAGPIHLVLTDVVMPRMRGPVLAAEIVKQRPGVAIVFLSGYTEEVISQSDKITGFTLVEKPYTAQALLHSIRRSLDEGAARQPLPAQQQ